MGTFEKFTKKSPTNLKRGKSRSAEKSGKGTLLLQNACKKYVHVHRFEYETSGSESKHLITRPRAPELCELPAEMRVVARKKSTRTFQKHVLIASVIIKSRESGINRITIHS